MPDKQEPIELSPHMRIGVPEVPVADAEHAAKDELARLTPSNAKLRVGIEVEGEDADCLSRSERSQRVGRRR